MRTHIEAFVKLCNFWKYKPNRSFDPFCLRLLFDRRTNSEVFLGEIMQLLKNINRVAFSTFLAYGYCSTGARTVKRFLRKYAIPQKNESNCSLDPPCLRMSQRNDAAFERFINWKSYRHILLRTPINRCTSLVSNDVTHRFCRGAPPTYCMCIFHARMACCWNGLPLLLQNQPGMLPLCSQIFERSCCHLDGLLRFTVRLRLLM